MTKRTRTVLVVGIFAIIEALLRLFFYYEAVYAHVPLLNPMPPVSTMIIINSINLALGLAGLLVISGFLLLTGWGYWGTVAVSIATVVFDGVSAATVSATAFAGLILPVMFLVLLLPKRAQYLGGHTPVGFRGGKA